MGINSYIDQFEQQGATLTNPVLPEGNYKANITAITTRHNKYTPKTGPNAGKEAVLVSWGARLALESETAQDIMKRDNDVMVYADRDTVNMKPGFLSVEPENGITFANNAKFWGFIGSLLAQVDLATETKDDTGASSYSFPRHILEAFYQGTDEKQEELNNSPDIEVVEHPALLAAHQINNISELICSESDTTRCYVHIARREKYNDKTQQEHFVKQIMLPEEFEAVESNLGSLIV